jgi:pimeloyl-ACP methyl ester carboxylesterase
VEVIIMKKYLWVIIIFADFLVYCYGIDSRTMYYSKSHPDKDGNYGYIFFDGFDFLHYQPETTGCEPMLVAAYTAAKEIMGTEPFVLVGHSQGGMRALAFATYVKYRDPDMYRQIKGIITLSGIDRGLRLLNNNGADFRRTMQKDGGTLARGVMALRISSIAQWWHFSDDDMNKSYSELTDWFGYSLAKVILESAAKTKGFAKPIMENTDWNSYAQIRDMCPQSNFIKKYILTENDSTYKR